MHGVPDTRALEALRVIELGELPAGQYAARLFADFGAEVIKVESLEGDATRRLSPCLNEMPAGMQSGWFAWLNAGKRSVALELGTAEANQRLQHLIASADILIDSLTPQARAQAGIDHATLRRHHPRLLMADVSWFGNHGPYAGFQGTDAICRALGGLVQLTGPKEGPPLALPDYQAAINGGLSTFVPLAASLYAGTREGGRRWEVSVLEACVTLAELQATEAIASGTPQARQGLNRYAYTFPLGIYQCREGWLGITILTPAQWDAFCELMGLADLRHDPRMQTGALRLPHADYFDERVSSIFLERTAAEWFEEGLRLRLPFVPVPDTGDLLASERFRQRGMMATFDVAGHRLEAPGLPWGLTRTPSRTGGTVPQLNEGAALWDTLDPDGALHENESASMQAVSVPDAGQDAQADGGMPLAGIRVVDLSMGWAGPLCTRQMADLGADVIKIESCGYADWWRGVSSNPDDFAQRLYEKSARFGMMNRNKRGITLDLTSAEGVRLVQELVKDADVVVENYSSGVLRKLGLDYAQLASIRPDLIMVSMSAFGSGGEISECRAYGSTLEQGSGLPRVSGRPDDPPVMNHQAYGDAVGGLNGACAVMVALLHRRHTGEGQHIDMSQIECMLPYVATWVMAHSANGHAPERVGNGHPDYAPHGIYRCAGEDSWLLVAATDDAMWRALCGAIGQPALADEPALHDATGRRRHAERTDAAIQDWTMRQDRDEAMFTLQAAGVAAGAVRAPFDLAADPHLASRGFWQDCHRPYIERHVQPSAPFRATSAPLPVRMCAPTLGQHNVEVLSNMLGLSSQAVEALEADGVIGTEAYPPARFVKQDKGKIA